MNVHSDFKRPDQPLSVVAISDALLNIKTLQRLTSLGKTNLYARIKDGQLPAIRLGKRCTRFRAADVQEFLKTLAKEGSA